MGHVHVHACHACASLSPTASKLAYHEPDSASGTHTLTLPPPPGDFNTVPERHLGGATIPRLCPDLLISESTYATSIREDRRSRERQLLNMVGQQARQAIRCHRSWGLFERHALSTSCNIPGRVGVYELDAELDRITTIKAWTYGHSCRSLAVHAMPRLLIGEGYLPCS